MIRTIRALLLLALFCAAGFSQEFRATLLGRIADTSGAAIPGAKVGVTNMDTDVSSSAVSTADGAFTVPYLIPGKYRLDVEAEGFKNMSSRASR